MNPQPQVGDTVRIEGVVTTVASDDYVKALHLQGVSVWPLNLPDGALTIVKRAEEFEVGALYIDADGGVFERLVGGFLGGHCVWRAYPNGDRCPEGFPTRPLRKITVDPTPIGGEQ